MNYAPSDAVPASATLTVDSDDADEPQVSVAVSGTGQPGVQDVNLPATALNSGDVVVGQTWSSTVAIQNLGTADLTVSALTMGGSADFTLNTGLTLPFVVPAGRQATVRVDYAPSAAGAASGTMTVVSDDPVDPSLPITLDGNGVAGVADINLPVVTFDFGDVVVGTTQSGFIAIQNVGTADLTVTSLGLTGNADLVLQTSAPIVIGPSRQVTVRVDYTPSATGPVTGTLTIGSDDADEPSLPVSILGNGAPAV